MKICFYSRFDQATLYPKIANHFNKDGVESIFITQDNNETKIVKQMIPDAKVYEIEDYLKTNWNNFDITSISTAEEKYTIDSLWRLFYSDRFLINFSYEDSVKFIVGHIKFYEEVFEKEKPDYFINEPVAIFSAYIEYYIGKFYNVQYYGFQVGRLETNSKIFLIKDPFQMNFKLDEKFNEDNFNEEELLQAEKYIENFRKRGLKPEAEKFQRKEPKITIKFLYHILRYIVSSLKEENHCKYNYMRYKQSIKELDKFLFYLRYRWVKKWFQPFDENNKFYYYPIHYEPEAATLICGDKFKNQLATIEQIAQNIPGDCKLYVKEHYTALIHKNIYFYKQIRKLPNVVLINPFVNSHELIKKSEGVITISGTGGWEGILYGKPVYLLGKIFYGTYPGINKVNDISELVNIIKTRKDINNDDILIKYIAAYIDSLYDGNYTFSDNYTVSDENARLLYNALLKVIITNRNTGK